MSEEKEKEEEKDLSELEDMSVEDIGENIQELIEKRE